ncbi:MAG: hypothetical protein JWO80_6077 [Bryobacterales bacterium]|nr:hypothetical protein [Bryobacterales bacterium]
MAKAKSGKSGKVSEDKIVRDVIKKYGDTINLKKTPFVLIEILRTHGTLLEPGDGGSPPGGTPPPPPGPASRRIDNELLLNEILKLGRQIKSLQGKAAK